MAKRMFVALLLAMGVTLTGPVPAAVAAPAAPLIVEVQIIDVPASSGILKEGGFVATDTLRQWTAAKRCRVVESLKSSVSDGQQGLVGRMTRVPFTSGNPKSGAESRVDYVEEGLKIMVRPTVLEATRIHVDCTAEAFYGFANMNPADGFGARSDFDLKVGTTAILGRWQGSLSADVFNKIYPKAGFKADNAIVMTIRVAPER